MTSSTNAAWPAAATWAPRARTAASSAGVDAATSTEKYSAASVKSAGPVGSGPRR